MDKVKFSVRFKFMQMVIEYYTFTIVSVLIESISLFQLRTNIQKTLWHSFYDYVDRLLIVWQDFTDVITQAIFSSIMSKISNGVYLTVFHVANVINISIDHGNVKYTNKSTTKIISTVQPLFSHAVGGLVSYSQPEVHS